MFGDVILSVAKNRVFKRVNKLRDSSSPAVHPAGLTCRDAKG
jgi:hypothetical protein